MAVAVAVVGRGRGGGGMVTMSAAASWTAEDDVLLKNAVEVRIAPTHLISDLFLSVSPRNSFSMAEFRGCWGARGPRFGG